MPASVPHIDHLLRPCSGQPQAGLGVCCLPAGLTSPAHPPATPGCSPAGTFSSEGDRVCTPCPIGQYNSLPGLPNQAGNTGLNCVACAAGSMPLVSGTAGTGSVPAVGSTFCDAWWVGGWVQ